MAYASNPKFLLPTPIGCWQCRSLLIFLTISKFIDKPEKPVVCPQQTFYFLSLSFLNGHQQSLKATKDVTNFKKAPNGNTFSMVYGCAFVTSHARAGK